MADSTSSFLKQNLGAIAAGIGGVAIGAATGLVAGRAIGKSAAKKKKSSSRKSVRKRSTVRRRKRKGGRYTPRTAGKGRDRSTRRIRYTKNGQPYVIMRSGKARFIKKKSAKLSHRRKGGRY